MLLSRVLLAGPLELPLASPAPDDAATDKETFEVARGRVTACFSVDTLHTGATGIAVAIANPHEGDFMVPDDALVDWVALDWMTAAPHAEHRFALVSGEDPAFWLSFVLPTDVINALRVLRDAVPLDETTLAKRTADLQLLLNRS